MREDEQIDEATAPTQIAEPAPSSPTSPAALLQGGLTVGSILNSRYLIERELGRGGIGVVYLARDQKLLSKLVVIKVLLDESLNNEWVVQKFRHEMEALTRVEHPGIIGILDAGETPEGNPYLVMQYVEGDNLRAAMMPGEGMELERVADIMRQVGDALHVAHEAGVLHRDLKPENIMLRRTRDGREQVKLIDFGIAKIKDSLVAPSTVTSLTVGTVAYMSPEQLSARRVSVASDVYALGIIAYEMVTGRRPFTPDSLFQLLEMQKEGIRVKPQDLRNSLPESAQAVIIKALAYAPKERYQSAREFGVALWRALTEGEEGGHQDSNPRAGVAASDLATTPMEAEDISANDNRPDSPRPAMELGHVLGTGFALTALVAAIIGFTYFFYFGANSGKAAITSVAVLPFVNASNDANVEYLSDGISESLINSLSRLPQMKVIARSSAFTYKGKEVDLQEVAKALGVQAIVTGRVVQRGDQLQVSAEMMNASDKTQIWGEQYNRKAADLQAIQSEISKEIMEKLRVRLTGAQEQKLTKQATQKPEAYQLYMKGLFNERKNTIEGWKQALDYYNQAITLDPNFALAYAGAASAYNNLVGNSGMDPKDATAKSRAAANKAVELDDTLAEAHASLGAIKMDDWDWSGAESEFKRAIELNPNLSTAHFRYAQYLSMMGRSSEALTEYKRGIELDPLQFSIRGLEGNILYYARRYDEAIQSLENSIKQEPQSDFNHVFLGYVYATKGQYTEAIGEYQKVISMLGEDESLLCSLGYAYAMSGRRDEALAILGKLKTTKEYVSPAELAILYAGLGDKEGALQSLERGYAAHDLQMQFLKVEPHFDSLRSEPRFQDLIRRVGLPQ